MNKPTPLSHQVNVVELVQPRVVALGGFGTPPLLECPTCWAAVAADRLDMHRDRHDREALR